MSFAFKKEKMGISQEKLARLAGASNNTIITLRGGQSDH